MIVGTSQNFQTEVLDHAGLVLVDFWATWCGPCQMLAPIIEELEVEFKDKLKVVKVDVDAVPDIANKYNVTSIPTVILFEKGQIKQTIIGFHQKQDFVSAIIG